ncbi:hypothetical protein JCM10213_005071 [Rhodosporidiobolus nylandii]
MLDRLPIELLDHTFDLIRSPLASNKERRRTLAAYCLVSQRCRKYAQPQLWREIYLDEARPSTALDSLAAVDQQSPLWAHVRIFVLGYAPGRVAETEGVFQRMVNLKELELYWVQRDLSCLSSLSNLRALRLYGTGLPSSFPSPFSSLREFTLIDYWPASQEALEMLDVGLAFLPLIPRALLHGPTRVLLSTMAGEFTNPAGLVAAAPAHVSLLDRLGIHSDYQQYAELLYAIRALHTHVHSPSRPLSPSRLTTKVHSADEDTTSLCDELYDEVQKLKKACEEMKVEVHWHPDNGFGVSPSFWRYAKKLKTAQQASGEV